VVFLPKRAMVRYRETFPVVIIGLRGLCSFFEKKFFAVFEIFGHYRAKKAGWPAGRER